MNLWDKEGIYGDIFKLFVELYTLYDMTRRHFQYPGFKTGVTYQLADLLAALIN